MDSGEFVLLISLLVFDFVSGDADISSMDSDLSVVEKTKSFSNHEKQPPQNQTVPQQREQTFF
jgi:hypothetical protein